VFPLLAVVCVLVSRGLSAGVEPDPGERAPLRAPLVRSRGTVARLSALFALDAGAGGFVVQAFLAFWLHRRFGAGPELIGSVLAIGGVLQAGSSIVAARLGARIGLINTMVFTHLPSNVALAAVAFAPNLGLAVALLLLRSALSQMDVPARQAYVLAMVEPEERTAASAFTNSARYVVRPVGAAGAGALMQRVEIGAPFVVSGALKIVYDIALYFTFRSVPLRERASGERSSETQGYPSSD
jgi:predicted MFS family arabinose efflux permease